MGMVKVKSLAGCCVWWQSINKDVEDMRKRYEVCAKFQRRFRKSFLDFVVIYKRSLGTHLRGSFRPVFNKGYLLLIIDAFSKCIQD